MLVTRNDTGMLVGLAVVADKHARDHCVVVIKGSFRADTSGRLDLADVQVPLVYADEHYGDPATTSIRYECDFALEKRFTDVLVIGKAVAPHGEPVTELAVGLSVEGRTKEILVFGDRRWIRKAGRLSKSAPLSFREMPLTFERAFGGVEVDAEGRTVAVEERNLVGVGIGSNGVLPNLEDPRARIGSPYDRPAPVGFGVLGRGWAPRRLHAGTYDKRWREERAPFLPDDFDSLYFQSAPEDQRFPPFQGGERVQCTHMASAPVVEYVLPRADFRVCFRFRDRVVDQRTTLDTVVLEPNRSQAILVWRASVPLSKKISELREIEVGGPRPPEVEPVGVRRGKPLFAGLDAAIAWSRAKRGRFT